MSLLAVVMHRKKHNPYGLTCHRLYKEKMGLAVTHTNINFEMGVAVLEQKYLKHFGFQNKT